MMLIANPMMAVMDQYMIVMISRSTTTTMSADEWVLFMDMRLWRKLTAGFAIMAMTYASTKGRKYMASLGSMNTQSSMTQSGTARFKRSFV